MRAAWPRCSLGVLAVSVAALAAAQEVPPAAAGAEHAFVAVVADRDAYFVHQPIRLRVRFGVDQRFLRDHLIQPFRQRLDLPVRLAVPWLDDLPGTIALDGDGDRRGGGAAEPLTFVLGDRLAGAARVEGDRQGYVVLEIERSYLPLRPGELSIPAPTLRYAWATGFRDDFLDGQVAVDRHEAVVLGETSTLRIEALPGTGRPAEFQGAVGRFSVEARAEPRDLAAGESLKLSLRIEGQGNLAHFDAPRLEGLFGFHAFGRIEETSETARTFVYDLAPLSEAVTEVPAIAFAFFDPDPPAGYHTVRTAPIPLTVRPPPAGARAAPLADAATARPVRGETDIFDIEVVSALPGGTSAARVPWRALSVLALVLPWLVALGLLTWRRARERGAADPGGARAAGAAARFRAGAGAPAGELSVALAEYLAARLGCLTAAVIAPELPARLAAAGVPAELAVRAAELLDGLCAVRFGGDEPAGGVAAARALVEQLEASFEKSIEEPSEKGAAAR